MPRLWWNRGAVPPGASALAGAPTLKATQLHSEGTSTKGRFLWAPSLRAVHRLSLLRGDLGLGLARLVHIATRGAHVT